MLKVKTSLRELLFVAVALAFAALPAMADEIVIGNGGIGQRFPFGRDPGATTTPDYQPGATYQQVYNGDPFGGPVTITSIAFASRASTGGVPGTATYNLTLRLGTAATTVGAVSSTFAANRGADLTTVFSGALTANLTRTNTFDLVINFSTPFTFNPANGDLLLDVTTNALTSYTGGTLFFDFGTSPNTSRVFNVQPSATGTVNQTSGLRTRFTFTPAQPQPIPEPATLILLGTGVAGVAAKVRRSRTRR